MNSFKQPSQIYTKVTLLTLSALISTSAWAIGPQCENLFAKSNKVEITTKKESTELTEKQRTLLDKQLEREYQSVNIDSYRVLKTILEVHPEFKEHKELINSIEQLIAKEELSSFNQMLFTVLTGLNSEIHEVTKTNLIPKLQERILEETSKFMPKVDAEARVKLLEKKDITVADLMQALGKMTAKESLQALIGKNGIDDIDPDSLVGRYLKQVSSRRKKEVSTFKGRFLKGPGYDGHGTAEKLYISVDEGSVKDLAEVIGANPHLLLHNHTPEQGTLEMYHQQTKLSYSGSNRDETSLAQLNSWNGDAKPQSGTIWPVIALSSIEASNAKNYFDLGHLEQKYAKYPWGYRQLKETDFDIVDEGYCAHGGYTSCTHWIGEMPIGEKLVSKYSVPGNTNDGHTDDANDRFYANPKKLRTQAIGTYNTFLTPEGEHLVIGQVKRVDRLARMVWKENQGHEQLWSMIGDSRAQGLAKGEWANPGWVLYSLLNRTKQERVPVVFIMRKSATAPLTQEDLDTLQNKIKPY